MVFYIPIMSCRERRKDLIRHKTFFQGEVEEKMEKTDKT